MAMAAESTKSSVLGGAIVEAIADAVVTLDTKGIVTSWNPAAESLLGHPSTEMVGTTLAALIPEEFRTRHVAGFHAALDSGALKHEGRPAHVRAMTADGNVVPLAMTLGLLRDPNQSVVGVVSVLRPLVELVRFA
jgi:PAS domain S-box-containing protein